MYYRYYICTVEELLGLLKPHINLEEKYILHYCLIDRDYIQFS